MAWAWSFTLHSYFETLYWLVSVWNNQLQKPNFTLNNPVRTDGARKQARLKPAVLGKVTFKSNALQYCVTP